MRALCGAIIAAGALIGLGLFSIGFGTRYGTYPYHNLDNGEVQWVLFKHMDTPLLIGLLALLAGLAIGLGVAFVGLAYHHHRRHLETLHHHHRAAGDRVTV